MDWLKVITIIASILIPMFSGFGWLIVQMFKIRKEISDIHVEILNNHIEILKDIRGIDVRLSHLEGYLIGFNQKTGTDNSKEKK